MNRASDRYRDDLAYIHDVGFGDFALKSAPGIIQILQENKIRDGLIVDLGCGSGLSAREFVKAKYRVLGIDISESMIAIARDRVVEAEFRLESLFKAEIPSCSAVTSVGECFNYLFDPSNDPSNNDRAIDRLFQRIHQALIPGGILIFDILEPVARGKTQGFREGKDWIVIFENEEDFEGQKLTRRITTLRQRRDCYQRDDEVHHVRLYQSSVISDRLEKVGFLVRVSQSYGQFQLSSGHKVFIATKNQS